MEIRMYVQYKCTVMKMGDYDVYVINKLRLDPGYWEIRTFGTHTGRH